MKKAVEQSITELIGLTLVGVVLLAFFYFYASTASILITTHEEDSSLNNFNNLVLELNELYKNPDNYVYKKDFPFFIDKGFMIVGFAKNEDYVLHQQVRGQLDIQILKPIECKGEACLCLYPVKETIVSSPYFEIDKPKECSIFRSDAIFITKKNKPIFELSRKHFIGEGEEIPGLKFFYHDPKDEEYEKFIRSYETWDKPLVLYIEKIRFEDNIYFYITKQTNKDLRRSIQYSEQYKPKSAEYFIDIISDIMHKHLMASGVVDYDSRKLFLNTFNEFKKVYPISLLPKDELLAVGLTFYEQRDYENAKLVLTQYIDNYPTSENHEKARYYLAESTFQKLEISRLTYFSDPDIIEDRVIEAISVYHGLIRNGNQKSEYVMAAYYNLGLLYSYLKDYSHARSYFNQYELKISSDDYLNDAKEDLMVNMLSIKDIKKKLDELNPPLYKTLNEQKSREFLNLNVYLNQQINLINNAEYEFQFYNLQEMLSILNELKNKEYKLNPDAYHLIANINAKLFVKYYLLSGTSDKAKDILSKHKDNLIFWDNEIIKTSNNQELIANAMADINDLQKNKMFEGYPSRWYVLKPTYELDYVPFEIIIGKNE